MEAMRKSWTDDRLDDFAGQVWRRFDEVDRRFDAFERRVNERFDEVDRRFHEFDRRLDGIDRRLERLEKRMDDLLRGLLLFGSGALVTLVVGFAGIIVTQ